ncbi:MAG TPA: cytochrome C [Bacteroidetes bacterium]|nr:cytochrome C [Bacteroidota bacterium]
MKLPPSYYNLLSFIGTAIAAVCFFMIAFLFIISFLFEKSNSYLGLFIYIIIPGFMVIGLLLIPLGMFIELRRRKKRVHVYLKNEWPVIDLNIKKYRNAIMVFGIGTIFLLLLTGLGSYEAFHYTESVEFCGTLCHEVMKPEHTAYQNSPHARVTCVECHVGSGAGWYVRSKLSGVRQVYAVLTNDFSRPIATPIHNLRPARETCEQCHWPQKFYSRQLRNEKHFLSDSMNTEWNISLQMKIGPEHSAYGLTEGIHWHINPNVKIDYISTEDNREEIPWVKYTNLVTGEVTIFKDSTNQLDDSQVEKSELRSMDCIDCHNRPTHIYRTPEESINSLMTQGLVSPTLPNIRSFASAAMAAEYTTEGEGLKGIETSINARYNSQYPEVAKDRKNDINQAVTQLQKVFSRTIFPEMKVSWKHYPNNVGHYAYAGCFRCHDGKHVSKKTGKVISKDCNSCHIILSQGPSDEITSLSPKGEEFQHPIDIGDSWKEMNCNECHNGQ